MGEPQSVSTQLTNELIKMKYDICVVSSSRADFGLLLPLLRRLEASDSLALKFLVTGSHLSLKHGYTVDEIEKLLKKMTNYISNIFQVKINQKNLVKIMN